MQPKIWFSYSLGNYTLDSDEPNRSPYARAWHLGRLLREKADERGYGFEYRSLDDTTPVTIGKDDIVVGHGWFNDDSFMQQALKQECRFKACIQPFTHHMVGDEALPVLHDMWERADWLFLVTGAYWFDTMETTPFSKYKVKATRLDNSVNASLHPYKKTRWNPPGKRAAMCVGYDNPVKGLDKVAELARVTGLRVGHFGNCSPSIFEHVPQATLHGGLLFDTPAIEWICGEYDFCICLPRFDANPTVLNETACWGLIGMCSNEAGYWADQPFVELRGDDMAFNWETIERFQYMSEYDLAELSRKQRAIQEREYTWQAMIDKVWGKVVEYLD